MFPFWNVPFFKITIYSKIKLVNFDLVKRIQVTVCLFVRHACLMEKGKLKAGYAHTRIYRLERPEIFDFQLPILNYQTPMSGI